MPQVAELSEFIQDIAVDLLQVTKRRSKVLTLDCRSVYRGPCRFLRYNTKQEPWCSWGRSKARKYLTQPVGKRKQCQLLKRRQK